jgi:hypothetical protein
VSRKSLTTDRFIRVPGGTEGEHDSPVDDEELTLLTHLKFLYITHKSSYHVYQKALLLRYIYQPVNAVTQTMAVYATGCIKHIRIHSADKRQIFSIFKQLVEQLLCCKQHNVFPILKTRYRNVILKLNMKVSVPSKYSSRCMCQYNQRKWNGILSNKTKQKQESLTVQLCY